MRIGADGKVAMQESPNPPRIIPKGTMKLADLAPLIRPRSTTVRGVNWDTKTGQLTFPSDFSGEIATDVATSDNVRYYTAKLANKMKEGEDDIYIPFEHEQQDYEYKENYLEKYVMVEKPLREGEQGGAGGSGLERHNFCHTDTPHEDIHKSGIFVLGKFLDDSETTLQLTGFFINRGDTLLVPAGVIHSNNYLRGEWTTMLAPNRSVEEVKLLKGGKKFHFTYRSFF